MDIYGLGSSFLFAHAVLLRQACISARAEMHLRPICWAGEILVEYCMPACGLKACALACELVWPVGFVCRYNLMGKNIEVRNQDLAELLPVVNTAPLEMDGR